MIDSSSPLQIPTHRCTYQATTRICIISLITAMSSEKASLGGYTGSPDSASLPQPNTYTPSQKTSTGKKVSLGLLALVSLWTVVSYLAAPATVALQATERGYLSGVADKGYRYALGPKVEKHHHGHHKHQHHGGHGDHDDHRHKHHPGKTITPKVAEEIYLQVPSNSSARE